MIKVRQVTAYQDYTITAAKYGNEEKTAIIVQTEEVAAAAFSKADTPEVFAQILDAQARGEIQIADFVPYVAPVVEE